MLNNRLFFNDFSVECTDNLSIRGFGLFRVRLRALWWMDSSLYPEKGASFSGVVLSILSIHAESGY